MANSLTTQDFVKGIDFSILVNGNGTQLNQLIELGTPAPGASTTLGVGFIICTADLDAVTPDVPNPLQSASYNKWQRYVWLRIPHPTSATRKGTLYSWNNAQGNIDPTLLNWWDCSADLTQLQTDTATALANSITALDNATAANTAAAAAQATANGAASDATTALTTSTAAQTTANTAAANAATASTTANTANTNALAAQGTANAAVLSAAAAQVTATAALAAATTTPHKVIFSVAGTWQWTCPVGVNILAKIKLWGAGGGGQYASTAAGAGGGGSGEYVEKNNYVVTPGTRYTIVIGAKGAGGIASGPTSAIDGANSSFNGGIAIAVGGKHGVDAGAGGIGGTGGTGDVLFDGYAGQDYTKCDGADSPNGFAGGTTVGKTSNTQQAATGYGAGGAGSIGSVSLNGGAGGDGRVELTY